MMDMEDGQQQKHQYRDKNTVDEDFINYPKDARQRRILSAMPMQYSKGSMNAKAALLDDLLSKFKTSCKNHLVDSEGLIKDRFHFVKKDRKTQTLCKRNLQNAALRMKEGDNNILDLVSEMKSSKFQITADQKDHNITKNGYADECKPTLTCNTIPRTTLAKRFCEVPSQGYNNSRVTSKLETTSINCDSDAYKNDMALNSNKPFCTDTVEHSSCMSFDVGAATANHQQSVVEQESNHRLFEQMENHRPLWQCVQLTSNNNY